MYRNILKKTQTKNITKKLKNATSIKNTMDYISYYFLNSSIHGFYHIANPQSSYLSRLFWLILVLTALYFTIILSAETLNRFAENPTVVSMERDRYSWNTSFPAATICPTFKLDEEELAQFISNSKTQNKTKLERFLRTLAEATYSNFGDVEDFDEIQPKDYLTVLRKSKFPFNPSVTSSGTNGMANYLHESVTEMGFCYSFNSQLAFYNSPSYWESGSWKLLPENDTFSVNPLDGEVFTNIVNIHSGFQVYVHGPYEVVDVASKGVVSPNGYFLQLYLSGLTLFSSDRTKSLNINQRKCRFYFESNLKHSPVYSYVLCRMECRATLSLTLCGCVPHFYRKIEKLILLKGNCTCLPNCDEVIYVVEDMDTREWFLGSNLQWGLKEYPKMRLKRDVLFGFGDLLVYIGGMAGLFLGCTALSIIEIIYFFTLRLFWFIVNMEHHRK